jgi:hypothetical protein
VTEWRFRLTRAIERSTGFVQLGPSAGEGRAAVHVAVSAMLPIIVLGALSNAE